ncbi:MAG: hypothetical protein DWQ54_15155 [Microcystis flos-aquae TF09]|uniref:Uncharacterized protein n=2 Tax=Microcystis TaxID=1125 RepID=A0A3E0L1L8_9CHRO|nr:MAG: hypothetical protein DWQ54_15155 [Microcystis flos-aquae TF09]REJ55012.1 MAG: hypothetical protein DWQ56_18830 [Microcystis aeruginosa DA14]
MALRVVKSRDCIFSYQLSVISYQISVLSGQCYLAVAVFSSLITDYCSLKSHLTPSPFYFLLL